MPSSIFLCHAHQDKEFVRELFLDLRRKRLRAWLDEAEIWPGESLIKKIEKGIEEMDYLGVVLSPNSVRSEWVNREVNMALTQEIKGRTLKVIPLLIEDCEIPGFLLDKLYVDFRERSEYSYSNSLELLVNMLKGKAPGIPATKFCVLLEVGYRESSHVYKQVTKPRSITVEARSEKEAQKIAIQRFESFTNVVSVSPKKAYKLDTKKRVVHPSLGLVTANSAVHLGILTGEIQYSGQPEGHWAWSIWIEPRDQKNSRYNDIKKVIYHLHHTYVDCNPQKTNWKDNFCLDRLGWQTFQVEIDLFDEKGEKIATIYHDLDY